MKTKCEDFLPGSSQVKTKVSAKLSETEYDSLSE